MGRFVDWLWARHRDRFEWTLALFAIVSMIGVIASPAATFVTIMWWIPAGAARSSSSVAALLMVLAIVLGLLTTRRLIEPVAAWGRGEPVDPVAVWRSALEIPRRVGTRVVVILVGIELVTWPLAAVRLHAGRSGVATILLGMVVLSIACGLFLGVGLQLVLRPVLLEIADEVPLGTQFVRTAWSLRSRLVVGVWVAGATIGVVGGFVAEHQDAREPGYLVALLAAAATAAYAAWALDATLWVPSLSPLRDLVEATRRVRSGEFRMVVPVTSADELGELVVAFNEMQHGLAEREALHAAFGSYVDPALAQRLIDSGSSLFEGEDVEVTVLFADVRDFTSLAEAISPAEAVVQLNRLFDVVVPVLHEHAGHANHYLGDGLLAVFGAPQPLERHADAAVAAAVEIQQRVRVEFGTDLRLGIGINTGPVIAGTVGGGGRHEFTVIGDTVNVASRVEQLTKETGDSILLTEATRAALSTPRSRMTKRGAFAVRGKAKTVTLHAVNPFPRPTR